MTDITLHLQSYNLDSDSPFTTIKYFAQILFFFQKQLNHLFEWKDFSIFVEN